MKDDRLAVVCALTGLLAAPLAAGGAARAASAGPSAFFVYFGTYTQGKSKGIYVSRLDPATGTLAAPTLAAELVSPSFLAVHPSGKYLFAVNEVDSFDGAKAGAASAFAIDAGGRLRPLNQSSTRGTGPCYVSVDRTGRHLLVANYGGGSVAVLPIAADGTLGAASAFVQHPSEGVDPQKPNRPHAHSIDVDPTNRYALVADLGLDRVFVYRFTPADGSLAPNDPPFARLDAGAGPRHVALHPSGAYAYVLNETHMTVDAFAFDKARGTLAHRQKLSALPDGVAVAPGFSGAEILVHPSGRFLYSSNRGHDTLAVFAIDKDKGTLTLLEHVPTGGKTPRGFGIDPSGRWLLAGNQRSDTVSIFRIDPNTGRLTQTTQSVEVGAPVSFAFVAAP
jgi:6-phosphogluconolactonase